MAGESTNLAAIRGLIDDAKPLPDVRRVADPRPGDELDGVKPGEWRPTALGLPPGCPVVPLGVLGNVAWFIDPIGQLQQLAPPYGKGHILGLFCGRADYLAWAWPRWGKKGVDGFAAEDAAAHLVHACAAKGPWSSVEKVRGRGAWLSSGGNLIVHAGTRLLMGRGSQPPGEIDGYVYPTRPAIPGPWPGPIEEARNPLRLLLPLFRSWQWARPEVDPVLLLGWIGGASIGGALPWRPTCYLTGDAATGKSTLQAVIKGLLGESLIQAVDTTAAGLYQHIGNDSLPVAVDEFEAKADIRAAQKVLELARASCSGGLLMRGGDRHNPIEFRARSCFLFSSINTPPLRPQDLSRMAILRLARLPAGQPPPDLGGIEDVGRLILRRMIDEWPRFAETLTAFKGELARGGMDGRGQDTFGTLLTCADMIGHQGWSEERLSWPVDGDLVPWGDLLAASGLAEMEDRAENWRACLSHLLSVRVDVWRSGHRNAVGQVLEEFWNQAEDMNIALAKTLLGQAGLTLVNRKSHARDWWLVVPNQNPLTRQLFEGSIWGGEVGAGVWAGALRQAPRGAIYEVGQARVNGDKTKCTLINLDGLYGDRGIMTEAGDDAA